jgi:hypothetical protein
MWTKLGSWTLPTIKGIGAVILGGVILWYVAQHSGAQKSMAYVHVSATNVEVAVDDEEYHIDSFADTPLVCELRPGRHMLRMARDGQVVYEEEFTLGPGKEVVLTAWERRSEPQIASMLPLLTFSRAVGQPPKSAQETRTDAECPYPGCMFRQSSDGPLCQAAQMPQDLPAPARRSR